jgi:hypothetical protein
MHKYDFNNFLKWSKSTSNESIKDEIIDNTINKKWKKYLENHIISSHILIIGRK